MLGRVYRPIGRSTWSGSYRPDAPLDVRTTSSVRLKLIEFSQRHKLDRVKVAGNNVLSPDDE